MKVIDYIVNLHCLQVKLTVSEMLLVAILINNNFIRKQNKTNQFSPTYVYCSSQTFDLQKK